ncbi:MAG: cyclase family protein [Alkalispirochaetaceae bacterium]
MRLIDLSQPIRSGMDVHPGDPEVRLTTEHTYGSHGRLLRRLTLGSHTGTHVDACSHMDPDGPSLSQLPIDRFIGPARITRAGDEHPRGVGLLFLGPVRLFELESILEASPRFVGGDLEERLERELLQRGIITYTGLVNLEELPPGEPFTFIGLPLPIEAGDGSPVRAVAMIEG